MLRLQSSRWGNSLAWMVDRDGYAISIENHVQKGDPAIFQLDEYALCCAYQYGMETGQQDYVDAAKTLMWEDIVQGMNLFEQLGLPGYEEVDIKAEVEALCETYNVKTYLQALGLHEFVMPVGEFVDMYDEHVDDAKLEQASKHLHTLYERLMMRVRVGGLTNSTGGGMNEIYFRIPDTHAEGWYRAIGNFLYDHPQFSGFELYIYQEAYNASTRTKIEEYQDAKQFLDLKCCKAQTTLKASRFNSFYKRKNRINKEFCEFIKGKYNS